MSNKSSYHHFAALYDELMAEAPYDDWLRFFKVKVEDLSKNAKKILDVGCGTGTLAIQLANLGFTVTGVDLSDEMLAIAANKAMAQNVHVTFVEQDMRKLQLGQTYDVVTAFCDSINYLENYDDVKETFRSVYEHLDHGGVFLFDVHSLYKIDRVFRGASYCLADDDISYIWECFEGSVEHSVEHELSFFVRTESGLYERYNEVHQQRTFDEKEYMTALEDVGFTFISVEGDFKEGLPAAHAERLFFAAIKK